MMLKEITNDCIDPVDKHDSVKILTSLPDPLGWSKVIYFSSPEPKTQGELIL